MLEFNETELKKVDELYSHEAEGLASVLATKYSLPYIDLSKFAINTDALRLIPEAEAREAKVAAFKITGKNLFVVVLAPANPKTQAVLKALGEKNFTVNAYLGSEASLARAWERYPEISKSTKTEVGAIDISDEDISRFVGQMKDAQSLKALLERESAVALKEGGISSLLEIILAGGIITFASDIHIEPQVEEVRLRYRLDGVLHDITFLDNKLYRHLLSRIKLVSGLKLNIQSTAQDGRFSIHLSGNDIEIRTSILPGAYGESIVLRLLNPKAIEVSFATLGIEPQLFKIVEREINKPNGMVLLTGPTGSGKTTTLYAFLRRVSNNENKIITIEDPIEYHLKGVNQTQVNPEKNYTFLTGLRSALRQDPDIIMVGEIRDKETAKIAINSSLTGHLVFSTLHTNNAAGTIPRLIDLEINPKIIESALNIAMAQRLVRVLCPDCKKADAPSTEEKKLLAEVVESIKKKRPDLVLAAGGQIWRAAGCDKCYHTGYRGRLGIFEAVLIDDAVAALMAANPNEREIRRAAIPQGILDMRQDGILKVLAGVTSLEELGRVVDINEEVI
ncbi:MAG: type II/IV secretion system protein [Candidatus Vogelbacteria bacterium]|nr:type II/IV secretion system protein [Candidatus Vogelbacteria bacterium]